MRCLNPQECRNRISAIHVPTRLCAGMTAVRPCPWTRYRDFWLLQAHGRGAVLRPSNIDNESPTSEGRRRCRFRRSFASRFSRDQRDRCGISLGFEIAFEQRQHPPICGLPQIYALPALLLEYNSHPPTCRQGSITDVPEFMPVGERGDQEIYAQNASRTHTRPAAKGMSFLGPGCGAARSRWERFAPTAPSPRFH